MKTKHKHIKKNPLTKAQKELLRKSLKSLLGTGLLQEDEKPSDVRDIVIRNAVSSLLLKN